MSYRRSQVVPSKLAFDALSPVNLKIDHVAPVYVPWPDIGYLFMRQKQGTDHWFVTFD